MIDPLARVDPRAVIASDAEIGPWVSVGPDVTVGPRTKVEAHCVIKGPTTIGEDNSIFPFCTIGDDPQDKKYQPDGNSILEIGDRNTIREYCSINRGTSQGGGLTKIGHDNWIMAYCHIAHDCLIGSNCVFANNSTLAGHVEVHDYATLGGFSGVHQFCRLGENSFSAISTIIVKDVPPFFMVSGNTARARGVNKVGLRRRGFSSISVEAVKKCYKLLYMKGIGFDEAINAIAKEGELDAQAYKIDQFIKTSERGIMR